MILKMYRVPPIIILSKSENVGSAGSQYCGIISISLDFPLWFVLYVTFHEFVHYISHFLPLGFRHKYDLEMWNETIAEKIKRLLPNDYKKKVIFDDEKIKAYIRWTRITFGDSQG